MVSTGKTALLIVDVQNDFCQGGSLEVKYANEIIPYINDLRKNAKFDLIVVTGDWHPKSHASFQSNNPGSRLFQPIVLEKTKVTQVMWPDHCIQGTYGAEFHKDLVVDDTDIIIHKGTNEDVDSYGAFGTRPEDTGLDEVLRNNGVTQVYVVGLAYDYCVGYTAIDAAKRGYKTYVIVDYTKSVSQENEKEMEKKMVDAGCTLIMSAELEDLNMLKA